MLKKLNKNKGAINEKYNYFGRIPSVYIFKPSHKQIPRPDNPCFQSDLLRLWRLGSNTPNLSCR